MQLPYALRRRPSRTGGRSIYYCQFRNEDGTRHTAVSTGMRNRAAADAWAREQSAVVSEALRKVDAPRRANNAVRRDFLLSPEEEAATLENMSKRDGLVFRFLLATGARVSEALGIPLAHCKTEGGVVSCPVIGKGGKTRELRVSTGLFYAILGTFFGQDLPFRDLRRQTSAPGLSLAANTQIVQTGDR